MRIAWNKGKKLSATHIMNLSKSHLGKPSGKKGMQVIGEIRKEEQK